MINFKYSLGSLVHIRNQNGEFLGMIVERIHEEEYKIYWIVYDLNIAYSGNCRDFSFWSLDTFDRCKGDSSYFNIINPRDHHEQIKK